MRKVLTSFVVFTTLLWAMGFAAFIPVASAATLSAGDLIKASGKAVYYYAADGGRYTFPTESTYKTWYSDFSTVKTITDDELAAIDLKGNVTVRAGSKLIKITTVPKVYAVGPEGMLYWVESEAAAKLLWGDNWASMVIDVPDGFFTNYTNSGESLDGTAYPEGALVSPTSSADVYYVNADGSWSNIANETAFNLNNWNWNFVVETALTLPSAGTAISTAMYNDVSQGGGAGVVASGNLMVALSSMTPAAHYVSKGAQNVSFAKFNLDVNGSVTISQIVLQRKGLGYDSDLGTVRLYNGTTQIGTDQSFNTNTHQVTFKNLNWTLTSDAVLTVKANTAASPSGTNDYFELVSVSAGTASVAGLPVAGNAMEFSNLSVGQFDVDAVSGSSTVTVISGATDQELGCWNWTTSSTEGFYVDSVMFTNIGSGSSSDALNFVLKQGLTAISPVVASMSSNGTLNFDMTASPYFLDKSKVKKVCLYGDIASGITVTKTIRFQVAEATDFAARGDSSAGEVLTTYSSGTTFVAQSAKTNTIAQGTATIYQSGSYNPTSGTSFVKGVTGNKMAAYKLTAGANEGVVLTKLKVTLAGNVNVANTDFNNWMLYKIVDGVEVEIPVSGSVSGLTITFEDTNDGLLEVAKSETEHLVVRADVSTFVGGNETGAHVYIGANSATGNDTLVKIKGLESGDYVTDGVTTSGVATGNAQTFSVGSYGTLVVSKATSSPNADTIAKGTSNVHLLDVNLYATGEDMEVSDLDITLYEDATAITTNLVDSGDVTNVHLTKADGTPLGTACSAPSTGVCSFSFSLDVPKELNTIVKVYADIPSSESGGYVYATMDTADTDITSTGAFSAADITESGTAIGGIMTVGSPTVVAAMATSPITGSYVINSTGVTFGKLVLTAGTSEDVKITSLKVSAGVNTDDLDAASTANTKFQNVKLLNFATPTTQYGTTQNFTDGTPDYVTFSGINNLTIPAGQSVTLAIVADAIGSSGSFEFGVADAATEITGTGVSSNASATITPNGSTIVSSVATLTTVGTLKVEKSADMPAAAQLVSGSTGNELMKYKLTASYENVDITLLPIYYTGTVADIANVKLYLNGTILGSTSGYTLTAAAKSINFSSGTFVVVKDTASTLTIKADLNPKAQVTTSASDIFIGIGDSDGDNSTWAGAGSYMITAKGSSSGATVTAANITSTGAAGGYVYGSENFTVHKGILTVTLNSNSPDGTATAGAGKEVMRFDLTATGDDIQLNEIEFCVSGSATDVTGLGSVTLKDSSGSNTYATITAAAFETYNDAVVGASTYYPMDPGISGGSCFSIGETADVGVTAGDSIVAWTASGVGPSISAGETKTFKLYGDTTGAATNKTLQVTIGPNSTGANAATTSGVVFEDSSTTEIDDIDPSIKNLPLAGGSLVY